MTYRKYIEGDQAWSNSYMKRTRPYDGTVFVTDINNTNYGAYFSDVSGGYLPGWQRLLELHRGAVTSLLGVRKSILATPGYARLDYDKTVTLPFDYVYAFRDSGRIIGKPTTSDWQFYAPTMSYQKASDLALGRFLDDARQILNTFQGGVFIGEIREAARAIRHPLDSLKRGISHYFTVVKKRSRKENFRNVSKMVAGTYLESVFGWIPLLRDIDDGARALANLTYRPDFEKLRVTSTTESLLGVNSSARTLSSGIHYIVNQRIIESGSVKWYGEVQIRLPEYPLNFLASNDFGLGLDEFLPTIYQLFPYSFLLDYVTNLGSIVNACSFPTANIAWFAKTIRGQTRNELGGSFNEQATKAAFGVWYKGGFIDPGRVVFDLTQVIRAPVDRNSIPLPSLRFKLNLGARKIANVSSLITQGVATERHLQRAFPKVLPYFHTRRA